MTEPKFQFTTSTSEAKAFGKSLRGEIRRSDHSVFSTGRRSPVKIIEHQNRSRLKGLIPVRIGRMLESPFASYRGTAAVMAHDLSDERRTGLSVVSCGDAHISNFGIFGSPDRRMLFDLNDFDESAPGPWEWDVKRLAASVAVGYRHRGFSDVDAHEACRTTVTGYRTALRRLHSMGALERYYYRVELEELEAQAATGKGRKALEKAGRKALKKNSERVLHQVTAVDLAGLPRIVDQPPILQHFGEFRQSDVEAVIERYKKTLRPDLSLMLSKYRVVDYALRIVGVGSVGTRCFIVLMLGPSDVPFFLQVKEAQQSVLETHGGIPPMAIRGLGDRDRKLEGYRVVSCQQVLQAASDPFLGWVRTPDGRDYYVRQFRDMKGSADLDTLDREIFGAYGELCGRLLARAHSQSPGSAAITGYLGQSDVFDRAIADWSMKYANQAEKDFEALEAAVKKGRLPAERGV